MDNITFQIENDLSLEDFKAILLCSTLGERRPMDDKPRLAAMLRHADLIITARHSGKLVGLARSITDQGYCTYLSDLAVDVGYQNKGIGKALIKETKMAYPLAKVILISAPKAEAYYPKIGMSKHENCFYLDDPAELL